MLDHLRKHSQSWIIKTILAVMTVGLILFFGYSGLRKATNAPGGTGEGKAVAVVNGENIPEGQFQQTYESQLKLYEQITKGNIPPALSQNIQSSVLKRLIDTALMSQQAKAIGLTLSNKELAQEITNNPNFYQSGSFNKKFYLDQFKPYYLRENGKDYEDSLRQDILAEKLEKFIRQSTSVSNDEVLREFLMTHTELNLQKIILGKAKAESTESAESQSTSQIESEILKALTDPTLPLAKNAKKVPSGLDAVLKKYNLKVEETGFHSLRDRMAFVGSPDAHEALSCIMKLNESQPICQRAYPVGDNLVLFKLISRKEPDLSEFEKEKPDLEKTLLNRRQALILQQISNSLSKQASIQSYLKPSS